MENDEDHGKVPTSSSSLSEVLIDDMWEEIFLRIECSSHRLLEPVSRVSKRFLAISNRAIRSLTISAGADHDNINVVDRSIPMASLCARFPNLEIISLCRPDPNLSASITHIAGSNLRLRELCLFDQAHFPRKPMRLLGQSMNKTLKSLSCNRFKLLTNKDLFIIADFFGNLQELDIEGSDLRVTKNGFRRLSKKLVSLVGLYAGFSPLNLIHFRRFSSLITLRLFCVRISNNALEKLSAANMKLQSLVLLNTELITADVRGQSLCRFLKSCRSLRNLELIVFEFPADLTTSDFAASIPNIQSVRIYPGIGLPFSTTIFVDLLKNCPHLEDILIANVTMRFSPDWFDLPICRQMRKLDLYECSELSDGGLKLIAIVCPELELLCVYNSPMITNEGIERIQEKCKNIKLLFVKSCEKAPDYLFKKEPIESFITMLFLQE